MKIYCSGIGGIGLSAYAALMRSNGHEVLGSDRALTPLTEELETQGISVSDKQDGSFMPDDIDAFVYSEAISEDSAERVKAAELGVKRMSYFEALGELSKDYEVIAVCGTHGKSSTTAMLAKLLMDTGRDPTVVVGTKVPQLSGKNWRKGESNLFVLEACEYKGSFFHLHPTHIIVTNVDWDHVDAYPTAEAYTKAYEDFVSRLPEHGTVTIHGNDAVSKAVADGMHIVDADMSAMPKLSVPGEHMQQNAALALALAVHLGVPEERARKSLLEFSGTWRRFEYKGEADSGAVVIDDYAHHPKEIEATVASAHEKFPGKRIVCLFQPHMHDRTLALYDDFTQAFIGAGEVWVSDIYEARKEAVAQKADVRALTEAIGDTVGGNAHYVGDVATAEAYCRKNLQQNDVLVVMGAGDITKVATSLVA